MGTSGKHLLREDPCPSCGVVKKRRRRDFGKKCLPCANKMEGNGNWKGGVTTHTKGYPMVKMKDHHRAHKNTGYVFTHIVEAEKAAGRRVRNGEVVHHKDEKKDNYSQDNLEITTQSEHSRHHAMKRERRKKK